MPSNPRQVKLSQLKSQLTLSEPALRILSHFKTNPTVYLVTYSGTEEIGNSGNKENGYRASIPASPTDGAAIVLTGLAELYQEACTKFFQERRDAETARIYYAYRPIRLFGPGDVFSDFSMFDQILEVEGVSRPGEQWAFCCGRKSILLRRAPNFETWPAQFFQPVKKAKYDYKIFHPGALSDYLFSETKTVVAFIRQADILEDRSAYVALLENAWRMAKIYRDAINSYNYHNCLEFRDDFSARLIPLKKKFTDKTNDPMKIMFSDALYDALNKPLRKEPTFSRYPFSAAQLRKLSAIGLDAEHLCMAMDGHAVCDEFLVPIDLHNHMLNSQSRLCGFDDDAIDWFGGNRDRESTSTAGNSRAFLRTAASAMLEAYLDDNKDYEYEVTCNDLKIPGYMDQLTLDFKKKTSVKR